MFIDRIIWSPLVITFSISAVMILFRLYSGLSKNVLFNNRALKNLFDHPNYIHIYLLSKISVNSDTFRLFLFFNFILN